MPEKRKLRLMMADAEGVIRLVIGSQLNEAEACRKLGIDPRVWFNWKAKDNRREMVNGLFEKARGDKISELVKRIEDSANGEGLKYPDWRAAAWLLGKLDPRFQEQKPGVQTNVQVTVQNPFQGLDVQAALKRVYGKAVEPKQLAEKSETDKVES